MLLIAVKEKRLVNKNYEFDLASFGVLGVGSNDARAIAALEQDETERLGGVDVLVVEEKVLIESEPSVLPLAARVVRSFVQVAALVVVEACLQRYRVYVSLVDFATITLHY